MKLITEPNIDIKIRRMKERVRWQHPHILRQGIDQTRLCLAGSPDSDEAFMFLVLGDSGTGRHRHSSPQRQVAQYLMAESDAAQFILHTGDVVYQVGSSEHYRANLIKPYREWLVGGESYRHIAYDRMIFKKPFLPVLGNHDYYDLPPLLGFLAGITGPLRYLLRSYMDLDVGWHGSYQGDAFARAFLDYLKKVPESRIMDYLAQHYTSEVDGDRCLTYRPGQFTRLPNRYYTFRYAGIDFFALDSNTFNAPLPPPTAREVQEHRVYLQQKRRQLQAAKAEVLQKLNPMAWSSEAADDREDVTGDIEQIDEEIYDIDKQLDTTHPLEVDWAQLNWLRDRLIASWQNPAVRGRIVFLHHPPYVTEATKWFQGQTLAVRHQLRQVLDVVAAEVGEVARDRPLLDLVLTGHAHCLEYLETGDTGHGDAYIPWVVCGGSGYSLRRQRPEGPILREEIDGQELEVATSKMFVGRSGKGSTLKRPYSGLKIEVQAGTPLHLVITPLIAEKYTGQWHRYSMEPVTVTQPEVSGRHAAG